MTTTPPRRRRLPGAAHAFVCLLALATWATPLAAQPEVPGTATKKVSGPGEKSALDNLLAALESGGNLLIGLMQPADDRGTVDNPRWNGLQSPRQTVLTFLEAMHQVGLGFDAAWPRALKTLEVPEGTDRAAARGMAVQLRDVLERFPPISPVDLPGQDEAEGRFRRFELFPRGLPHDWIWQRLEDPPEQRLALLQDGEGLWRFSSRSLAELPALHASLIRLPPIYQETERGQRFLQVFDPTMEDTPWWGWLALLAALVAGYGAARLLRRGSFWLCRRLERADRPVAAAVARSAGTPAALFVFSILLTVGLAYVQFGPALQNLRWDILQALMVLTGCWLLIELIDLVSALLQARLSRRNDSRFERMAVTALRRALRAFVLVLLAIFLLQNLVGIDIGAFLAGVGIIGLAISLAGQDSIKNLFGALSIFINRPFMVGDWIRFEGKMGEHLGAVEDIGMQATTLREIGGDVTTIPNMLFIDREVDNLSARSFIRRQMDISLPYHSTPEQVGRALKVVEGVLRDDEVTADALVDLQENGPEVSFSGFGAYALNIRAYHWYRMGARGEVQRDSDRGWYTYLKHCSLVNRKLFDAFDEAGLDFAFPTQTLELRGADGPALRLQDDRPAAGTPSGPRRDAVPAGRTAARG